jgi:hypothetical protein
VFNFFRSANSRKLCRSWCSVELLITALSPDVAFPFASDVLLLSDFSKRACCSRSPSTGLGLGLGSGSGLGLGSEFVAFFFRAESSFERAFWSFEDESLSPSGLFLGSHDAGADVKVRIECRLRKRAVRETPWRLNIEIQYGRATGTSRLIMPWENVRGLGVIVARPILYWSQLRTRLRRANYERRAVGGDKPT